ncbi:MAG: lipocalin family protein [Chitinophagaceae bacterium]
MKLKHILSGILLMSAMAFVSCKGKPKDLIVNKWKMTDISGGQMAAMPDSIKKDIMDKATLEFTKDGKYMITGIPNGETGAYTLTEDGKTLTMTPSTGGAGETSELNEIAKDKMVMTGKSSGSKITAVPR